MKLGEEGGERGRGGVKAIRSIYMAQVLVNMYRIVFIIGVVVGVVPCWCFFFRCVFVCVGVCVIVCVCVCLYVFLFLCVCMCVFARVFCSVSPACSPFVWFSSYEQVSVCFLSPLLAI